jgi:uncharacterized Zn finger protein
MSESKKALAGLLSHEKLKELALPSNYKYGKAIYDRGGVEIIDKRPDTVEAWVGGLDGSVAEGGSQRRRTRFAVTAKGLTWTCTESAKPDLIFCKHCVALGLAFLAKQ